MKKVIPFLTILIFAAGLSASPQTLKVSPAALNDWTITGAERGAVNSLSTLVVPAGAQLSRTFPGANLAINITSQPFLGVTSADWPVLEIGSAALLVSRDGSNGRLLLVVGDKAPVVLPVVFPLDADGRSQEPLRLGFARHDANLVVEVAGKISSYPLDADSAAQVDLVISAGAGTVWVIDSLDVTMESAATLLPSGSAGRSGMPANNTPARNPPPGANSVLKNPPAANDSVASPAVTLPTVEDAIGRGSALSLEVFTPPAVRRGRAETVRETAAQSPKK